MLSGACIQTSASVGVIGMLAWCFLISLKLSDAETHSLYGELYSTVFYCILLSVF
jgi:hypothetical protein